MATIKSYTDISQSKTLSKILPLESADMNWHELPSTGFFARAFPYKHDNGATEGIFPCWSLAALISILPVIIGDVLSENALRLRIDKSETNFNVWYDNLDTGMVEEGFDIIETNPIDAFYEMIIRLHELNLL